MNRLSNPHLADLPDGIDFTSYEDEVEGRWVINYTWEVTDYRSITFMVFASEVEGLVAQAEERAREAGTEFSLEETRREVAPTVLVKKVLDTINRDDTLAEWRRGPARSL
jgi:hypothetical protein